MTTRFADALVTHDLTRAVAVLRSGGLVGLPTETVYGLAADAADARAVARVFAVKGRPADHPLIIHVAEPADLSRWARDVPAYAHRLAERLWPGPLTLVLPRGAAVGDHVTGGQPTVGLRCPSHPVAHEVLAAFGGGAAAPSANRFGRVSPTTAAHVVDELGDRLDPATDVVLDGGPSAVGVESTILDCTGPAPRLLRRGAVTADAVLDAGGIALVTPDAATRPVAGRAGAAGDNGAVRAPGMLAAHYAPTARVVVLPPGTAAPRVAAALAAGRPDGPDRRPGPRSGLLAVADVPTPPGAVRLAAPQDDVAYARGLYAALREADLLGLGTVVAVPPEGGGALAAAVRDRLQRAAAGSGGAPGRPG